MLQRTQAYGWAPLIAGDQRVAFEREVRQQGLSDFSILDLDSAGGARVAGVRAHYAPLLYKQTSGIQGAPLGADVLAQPARRETLDKAREQGVMVVSQPLLLQGVAAEFASGVLLAAPAGYGARPRRKSCPAVVCCGMATSRTFPT